MPYVGPTHFSAILDDIAELKQALGSVPREEDWLSAPVESDAGYDELIFGSSSSYSFSAIVRQYLPSRREANRLFATYFRNDTFVQPFIHTYHFQQEYPKLWDNNDIENVSPLWMSATFSIFHMASMMANVADDQFHIAARKCLVAGQYHKPQIYAAEALIIYAHCKALKSMDPSREVGAIVGMAVRIAYQLGYHRDPDRFSGLSPFHAEIRRRFWSVCKQMDVMLAFQLGLPSSIIVEHSDTRPPRNLLDSDFDESTTFLPESRPETEATKLLWFVVKDRLMPSFGKVCNAALSLKPQSEDQIAQLDAECRAAYSTIPEILRARPMSESLADAGYVVLTRLFLELIHLKGLCILHRKPMFHCSHFCLVRGADAAVRLATRIVDMHSELAPGGQLHAERWMVNAFTLNDFHLGVMMLLSLYAMRTRGSTDFLQLNEVPNLAELSQLLEQAWIICNEQASASRDARKVSVAIRLTLDQVRPQTDHNADVSSLTGPINRLDSDLDLGMVSRTIRDADTPGQEFDLGSLDPFNFMSSEFFDFGVD